MSLLTKEQLQIVNGIKAMIADYDYKTDQIRGLFDLVSIIDDLQARAPKQYTEQELRDKFESQFIDWDAPAGQPEWLARVEGAEYVHPHINSEFVGWEDCARKIGALKAEP